MNKLLKKTSLILSLVLTFAVTNAHAGFIQDCNRWLTQKGAPVPTSLKPTVIVIDGYSSGHLLAPALKAAGFQTVHVHSFGAPPKAAYARSFRPGDYQLDFGFQSLSESLEKLKSYKNIVAVLPGADTGVLLGDELGNALKTRFPKLPTNRVDEAHKDKFLQHEALAAAGIDSALQLRTNDVEAAITWLRKNKLFEKDGQLVIKPLRSAGTDGIYFCTSEAEVREAMGALVGKKDQFGILNADVLLQEYLAGNEYVVNTTSLDGHHVVTDMWQYVKKLSPDRKRDLYDYDFLLPYDGDIQRQLIAYNLKVLKALGIENGNGHSEIKMVPGRGPVLVEMNNRMMGSNQPVLTAAATGHSQLDRTVLSLTNPAKFKELPTSYKFSKYAAVVSISNFQPGVFLNMKIADELKKVPGYFDHSFGYGSEETLPITADLTSCIATVRLVAETQKQLEESIAQLKKLEREGHFTTRKPI